MFPFESITVFAQRESLLIRVLVSRAVSDQGMVPGIVVVVVVDVVVVVVVVLVVVVVVVVIVVVVVVLPGGVPVRWHTPCERVLSPSPFSAVTL